MKVGIMTMYYGNYNFGGQLQALALQHIIENLGHECEVINFSAEIKSSVFRKLFHTPMGVLARRVRQKALYTLKDKTDKGFHRDASLRKERFQSFMKEIPHTEFCSTSTINTMFGKHFDACIVGSDQVWNPQWWVQEYFLNFVWERTKKIAYAASLGVDKLSDTDGCFIADKIKDFTAVSLREEGGKRLLEGYVTNQLHVTLDPTLLYTRKMWDTIAVKPTIEEPYVVVYFPGGKSESALRTWHEFCIQENLKLVVFPHFQGKYDAADEKFSDIRDYSSGPAQFLGLIKYAKYVMTGSFHATVFSIIFQKQFVSFREKKEMNTPVEMLRNGALLAKLGLEDRLVPRDWEPQLNLLDASIDYDGAEEELQVLRRESMKFLEKALDGEDK